MKILVMFLLNLFFIQASYAYYSPVFYKKMTYEEAKKEYLSFLSSKPSNDQKLAVFRNMVKASEFGSRGLNNIYKNFDESHKINVNTPGIDKHFLMMFSSNPAQRKGYRRELLTYQYLNNDDRFSGFEIGKILNRPWGKTDADIYFTHKETGAKVRVEVKDYSISSQKPNLKNLKLQIDKMSKESRYYKTSQFWINHHEVLPELKVYAESKGVTVIENVKTGKAASGLSISDAKDIINDKVYEKSINNTKKTSFVASMTMNDSSFSSPFETGNKLNRLSPFSLGKFSRFAGALPYAAFKSAKLSFTVERFLSGRITRSALISDSITTISTGAGALAGAEMGATVGGAVGSFVPVVGTAIGSVIGTVAGGVVGTISGSYAGSLAVGAYNNYLSDSQNAAFGKFIYAHYGVSDIN